MHSPSRFTFTQVLKRRRSKQCYWDSAEMGRAVPVATACLSTMKWDEQDPNVADPPSLPNSLKWQGGLQRRSENTLLGVRLHGLCRPSFEGPLLSTGCICMTVRTLPYAQLNNHFVFRASATICRRLTDMCVQTHAVLPWGLAFCSSSLQFSTV